MSNKEEFEEELLGKISLRSSYHGDWNLIKKIIKSIIRDFSFTGVKWTMKYMELLCEDNAAPVTITIFLEEMKEGLPYQQRFNKRLRSLSRAMNLEESRNQSTSTSTFRIAEGRYEGISLGDVFDAIEGCFEEILEQPLGIYLSTKNPDFKRNRKIRKQTTQNIQNESEMLKEFTVVGYDDDGKPMLKKKSLMELHEDGVYDDDARRSGMDRIEEQKKSGIQWGEPQRKYQKDEKDDQPVDEWTKSRFNRDEVIGTNNSLDKQNAKNVANLLTQGTSGRFTKGQVSNRFL